MESPVQTLKDLPREHDFFIGVDSDGCAFDSMEIKHKECFCPQFINHFDLQAVSKFAREVWDFVNLYSKTRGCNRYLAVLHALDFLRDRREVRERHVDIPELQGLRDWVGRESKLGIPALEQELKQKPDADLERAYHWSLEVNQVIAKMVRNLPPFPYVEESLQKMVEKADTIVVSQTPFEALEREWNEHDIAKYVRAIAGQEMGKKSEHIQYAADGKYDPEKILMIGDAPGDLKAARANGALFYPINPGAEEESWKRFYEEALDKFFDGSYAGAYERELIDDFQGHLPESPPWK
ncbi:MAG TPA: HAD family hydrolase [Sediminispirochaeta sp.]|nr:HAD family hydrolase [Sediminispirochaeta sp.]